VNIVQSLGKLLKQETLHINSTEVKTQAKDFSKMLVPIYQSKQYHIPEHNLINHHCKNQKLLTLICTTWFWKFTENTYLCQYKSWLTQKLASMVCLWTNMTNGVLYIHLNKCQKWLILVSTPTCSYLKI
jgi:hypothetical protein